VGAKKGGRWGVRTKKSSRNRGLRVILSKRLSSIGNKLDSHTLEEEEGTRKKKKNGQAGTERGRKIVPPWKK